MNQTSEQLLLLLRRALFTSKEPLPDNVDWPALLKEAKLHAVIPLTFSALTPEERVAMPKETFAAWRELSMRVVYQNERLLQEQKSVLAALKAANIPCAILKGSSVACNYPEPSLRALGDVDLLVPPEQQRKAVSVLQSMGYGEILSEGSPCHLEVKRESFSVEVHKEPNGLFICEDAALKRELYDFFAEGLENIQQIDKLPILPCAQQALTLLLHKLGHFMHTGLGLRQLCDWAAFVDRQITTDFWGELEPKLQRWGLLTFTQFITKTCILYLGLPAEKAIWAAQSGTELPEKLMEEISKTGNFGSKGRVANQTMFTNVYAKSPLHSFARTVVHSAKVHFPISEKHPSTLVFTIPADAVRFAYTRLTGKKKAVNFAAAYKDAGEKQRLYHDLKPFVTNSEKEHKTY